MGKLPCTREFGVNAKLAKNLLVLYGGECAAKVVGMAVFAFLARSLGSESYGDLEFAIAAFFVLNLVQEAGLATWGAREAAQSPERCAELAGRILVLRLVLASGAIAALVLLALGSETSPSATRVLLCYSLPLLLTSFFLNWAFQSRDEMEVVAAGSLLRQLVLAAGVLLLVRGPEDAPWVPLWDGLGIAAVVAFEQLIFRRRVGRIPLRGALKHARAVLASATPLAISTLAWSLRIFFPLIALRLSGSGTSTAHFATGHRLSLALHTFVWLYFFNLLPTLTRSYAKTPEAMGEVLRVSLRLVCWTVLPGCLVLCCASPLLVTTIFGSQYASSAPIFSVQVWMLALAFLSGHQRFGLIAAGRQDLELRANAAGTLVAVGGCLALGGSLDARSAAIIFVAAEGATGIAAAFLFPLCASKLRPSVKSLKPLLPLAVAASICALFLAHDPLGASAATLGITAAGFLLLDRSLLQEWRRKRAAP